MMRNAPAAIKARLEHAHFHTVMNLGTKHVTGVAGLRPVFRWKPCRGKSCSGILGRKDQAVNCVQQSHSWQAWDVWCYEAISGAVGCVTVCVCTDTGDRTADSVRKAQ